MSDFELTKLCAQAMGHKYRNDYGQLEILEQRRDRHEWRLYDPLRRDAQAMILVKEMQLCIQPPEASDGLTWHVWKFQKPNYTSVSGELNRAIVECVAKMEASVNDPN